MTTPATTLEGCLPADNDDHGPIAVPSDAVRGVLAELEQRRKAPQVTYRAAENAPGAPVGPHTPSERLEALHGPTTGVSEDAGT